MRADRLRAPGSRRLARGAGVALAAGGLVGCAAVFGFEDGRLGDLEGPAGERATRDDGGTLADASVGDAREVEGADDGGADGGREAGPTGPTAPPCVRGSLRAYFCDDFDDRPGLEPEGGGLTMASGVFFLDQAHARSPAFGLRVTPPSGTSRDDGLAWRTNVGMADYRVTVSLAVWPARATRTGAVTLAAVVYDARGEVLVTLRPSGQELVVGLAGAVTKTHAARLPLERWSSIALRLEVNDAALDVNGSVETTTLPRAIAFADVGVGAGGANGSETLYLDDVTVDAR